MIDSWQVLGWLCCYLLVKWYYGEIYKDFVKLKSAFRKKPKPAVQAKGLDVPVTFSNTPRPPIVIEDPE